MLERIKKLSKKYTSDMIKLRRHLHQIPETALMEFETKKSMTAQLKKIGLKVNTSLWRTSLVALLEGKKKAPCIAIRTDMDALPVTEQTGYFFESKNKGFMHACGHDAHMAIVWGAAKILSEIKSELAGSVKFLYQPAEEEPPGGAKSMIAAGALTKPSVSAIFGLHVDPTIPVGKIGLKDGPMMARVDDFNIIVRGRSGHGARPHETVDAIVVASELVTAFQTIPSRKINPLDPVVVTIGKMEGGIARNVIADEVILYGTARSLDKKVSARISQNIKRVTDGVCRAHGAKYEFDYQVGYPVLDNSSEINCVIREAATGMYGRKAVADQDRPGMGAEDFACYLEKVPGAMFLLGIRNKKVGADKPWHHPQFKIDEKAIPFAASILAGAVWEYFEVMGK